MNLINKKRGKSYFCNEKKGRYIAVNEMDMNERMSTIGNSLLIGPITLICSFVTVAFTKEKLLFLLIVIIY